MIIVMFAVILTVASVLALRIILRFSDVSQKIIPSCVIHIQICRTGYSRKSRKMDMLRAQAMKPIKFMYYPFNEIDHQLERDLLANMILRICDALLIF